VTRLGKGKIGRGDGRGMALDEGTKRVGRGEFLPGVPPVTEMPGV
jgi:hypothetical protein